MAISVSKFLLYVFKTSPQSLRCSNRNRYICPIVLKVLLQANRFACLHEDQVTAETHVISGSRRLG